MGREQSIEDKKKYIKATYGNKYSEYIGHPKLEEAFCKLDKITNKKLQDYVFYGKREALSIVGAYFITLRGGVMSPLEYTFEQAVDISYSNDSEASIGFKSCKHPLLFIYVNLKTSLNKIATNEGYLTQLFHNRNQEGNHTIILCEIEGVLPSIQGIPFVKTINLFKNNKNISANTILKGMKD